MKIIDISGANESRKDPGYSPNLDEERGVIPVVLIAGFVLLLGMAGVVIESLRIGP